ncbi:Conserved_hypothetical protein [Hexamita inflata]|uniref:Transmembrane protein n=1 Tax=Hexamita inflata TaxID=28002 RepID=A0AA86TXL8_9EUKA|nr:Conserved hypothetical protein [Hexamita inflata]
MPIDIQLQVRSNNNVVPYTTDQKSTEKRIVANEDISQLQLSSKQFEYIQYTKNDVSYVAGFVVYTLIFYVYILSVFYTAFELIWIQVWGNKFAANNQLVQISTEQIVQQIQILGEDVLISSDRPNHINLNRPFSSKFLFKRMAITFIPFFIISILILFTDIITFQTQKTTNNFYMLQEIKPFNQLLQYYSQSILNTVDKIQIESDEVAKQKLTYTKGQLIQKFKDNTEILKLLIYKSLGTEEGQLPRGDISRLGATQQYNSPSDSNQIIGTAFGASENQFSNEFMIRLDIDESTNDKLIEFNNFTLQYNSSSQYISANEFYQSFEKIYTLIEEENSYEDYNYQFEIINQGCQALVNIADKINNTYRNQYLIITILLIVLLMISFILNQKYGIEQFIDSRSNIFHQMVLTALK